jgi:hypothetical protein
MEEAADPIHEVMCLPEARHVLLLARVDDALVVRFDPLPAVGAEREASVFRHAGRLRLGTGQRFFRSLSSCFHVRVFATSAFVSHPRRACATASST